MEEFGLVSDVVSLDRLATLLEDSDIEFLYEERDKGYVIYCDQFDQTRVVDIAQQAGVALSLLSSPVVTQAQ